MESIGPIPASQRDQKRVRRGGEEERDLRREVAVERDRVGEEPWAAFDCGITRGLGAIDRKQRDTRPPEPDEDTVRTGHVRDREISGRGRSGARLPRVQRVDRVLRGDRKHGENRDGESLRNVFLRGLGRPREQKRCSENRDPCHDDRRQRRHVLSRVDCSVSPVRNEQSDPRDRQDERQSDGHERVAKVHSSTYVVTPTFFHRCETLVPAVLPTRTDYVERDRTGYSTRHTPPSSLRSIDSASPLRNTLTRPVSSLSVTVATTSGRTEVSIALICRDPIHGS